jgi:hypothetical protein
MNRAAGPTASINAVLANEMYHREQDQQYQHQTVLDAANNKDQGAPKSPSQPTTPQFSWPRRVRSPEPHLPLRKASPERLVTRQRMASLPLQQKPRQQKPALPLFITTNGGREALGPVTTGGIVAPPHSSHVNVKSGNNWWDDVDDSDHNNNNIGIRQRNFSAVEPSSSRRGQLSSVAADAVITSRLQRQGSWPLEDKRASSVCIPDIERNGGVRGSYRSQMTTTSSHVDSTGTTRSSVATADSSVSDCVRLDYADSQHGEDDEDEGDMSGVEDALLDMYIAGFGTPVNLSVDLRASLRQSLRLSVGSHSSSNNNGFLHAPKSSVDTLGQPRPGTSPSANESGATSLRRSHSASMIARKSILADVNSGPFDRNNRPSLVQNERLIAPPPTPTTPAVDNPSANTNNPAPAAKPVPRDRYGFKKTSMHNTVQEYDTWDKEYNLHLERRRAKWTILMKQFGYTTENPTRFPSKSEKMKRYVRKGIPPDWRGAAWFWYAGGPQKLADDPGLYTKLLKQVNQGALSDSDREHIERDLNRTFPDNDRFKPDNRPTTSEQSRGVGETENETPIIKALRRVLQAFAVHNPNIGYCQSLNFIAGLLLLFLDEDEEKAFVLLNVVTTEHLPGTHGVALEGANIDIAVLMTSIRETLPTIWTKLDDKPTTPAAGAITRLPTVSLATTAWFMSLFVGTLPIECVLRVWDCLFFEGSKTLFRVALAIFKCGETAIKAVNDPMEIFQVVQSMPRGMLDANALMEMCFRKRGGFGGLSQDLVEKRREEGRVATRAGRTLTAGSEIGGGRDGEEGGMGRRSFMRAKSKTRFSRRQTKGA